jgi:hypothetical protein
MIGETIEDVIVKTVDQVLTEKETLREDSVKLYKGFNND